MNNKTKKNQNQNNNNNNKEAQVTGTWMMPGKNMAWLHST
jgi:hypothetical protein